MPESPPRVVVTGVAWMGAGIGSIGTAFEDLLRKARHEVLALMFSLGTGGLDALELLVDTAEHGLPVIAIVNHLETQPVDAQRVLQRLILDRPWAQVWDFSTSTPDEELHAKAIVVDRYWALIGSPNISRRGLLTNYEIGVVLEGEPAAQIAMVIDRLRNEPTLVRRVWPGTGPAYWNLSPR